MTKILYKNTNFKKVGFSTMAFTAKILSWRFRHLNIVGCLLKRRPTKGGSRAPQDPPNYAPERMWLTKLDITPLREKRRDNGVQTYYYIGTPLSRLFSLNISNLVNHIPSLETNIWVWKKGCYFRKTYFNETNRVKWITYIHT